MGNTKKKRSQQNYDEENMVPPQIVKEYRLLLRNYMSSLKYVLMTSRFDEKTWEQNGHYRKNHPKVGCIYGSPSLVTKDIPLDMPMIILEMNLNTNSIMGIGLVKNHPVCGKYVIYGDNMNTNRYVYIGKNRVDRSEMTKEENEMMKFFDILCFRGNKHMKRGNGLSRFPPDILFRCSKVCDLTKYVCDIIKRNMSK